MIVYSVLWSPEQVPGRTKCEHLIFSVLCRKSSDALTCLECIFDSKYLNSGVHLSDGVTTMRRVKLDSRNFNVDYLMMDGIKNPICLHDVKRSLTSLMPKI